MRKLLLVGLLLLGAVEARAQSIVQAEVPDRGAGGALGALNNAVTVTLSGRRGVGGYVTTGTLVGTVTPEVTIDGTNWLATSVYNFSAGAAPVRATTISLNTLFGIEIPSGTKQARIRVSAYTGGTSTGTLLATTDEGAAPIAATIAGTVTVSGTVTATQGTGTNLHTVVDSGTITTITNPVTVTDGAGALNVIVDSGTTTVTQGTATNLKAQAEAYQGGAAVAAGNPLQVSLANTGANSNKILVTPDSVALPANQSTNVAQVAGTTTDTNSGSKSAGTMRVVLATDQPALTNKLLVTPDSVALPANQSVNVAQVAGTTTDTNSGNKSAGTQRVVLATDQPNLTSALNVNCTSGCSGSSFADSSAFTFTTTPVSNTSFVVDDVATNTVAENSAGAARMNTNRILYIDLSKTVANTNKLLVTPDSVALPANQSVNVNQLAGTTTDTNSGTKSAGTLRVVLATDQPALTNKLLVTPDSVALPANQSVNVAQLAGTATSVNNGTVDAGTLRVTVASNSTGGITSTPVKVSTSNSDGACISVSSNTTVLASFSTRSGATIKAQCDPSACNTDTVFVKLAATATTSDFPLAPGESFIINNPAPYTGIIDAIANSGTQKVCVLEW